VTDGASLSGWLAEHGLEKYAERLSENAVGLDVLAQLTETDFKDLGIPLGDRKRMLRAMQALSEDARRQDAPQVEQHAERRQLTVMFCDLVGSTALSQTLDPEALRELMRAYQKSCGAVIERYGGHVAQYLGDGLMVYFGWPRAHEDDAERAIRSGLEIVEAIKQVQAPESLQVRIGIATGPVVVGDTGGGDASVPKLAVGETPNTAARIQSLAKADQVLLGASTRRLVGETFELNDLGEHVLKGIIEPVRTWHAAAVAGLHGRFDAAHGSAELTPLVGRDLELGLLMDRWARAREGEGQVVLLGGEPGIGKSRILSALREKLEDEGAKAMRFQCSPYYINSAFWPTISNLERALKFKRDESSDSKLEKLESLIVDHHERPLADVRFAASILSIPCEQRYGQLAMTPQKFKDETLRTLVDITEAAARKRSSVMVFEDLHWADPTSLEVLDLMIDRVQDIPLLMVLTHRPEFSNRWADHGHVSALNLSRLTKTQSNKMIAELSDGKALPNDLVETICAKTDGVPLFVEELTKSILESGQLQVKGERYEYVGKSHGIAIPATLRDSLMARLDRFAPVKEIAQIGAAIGREFSYELVAEVASLERRQLEDVLTQLTNSGLAFRRGAPPQATYTFKHALVQDAAYDSLLKSRRQELHARIAQALQENFAAVIDNEPEVLANHLTLAGRAEAAIPLWKKAGEIALQRMAVNEAIAHLTNGLALIDSVTPNQSRDARELELRTSLGTAWIAAGGWAHPCVWSSYKPALDLARSLGRRDLLSTIFWGVWVNVLCNGRIADSVHWAQEMLVSAGEGDAPALELVARITMMVSNFWLGDFTEATQYGDQVSAMYSQADHGLIVDAINTEPLTMVGLFGSHWTWMLGFPDRAKLMCDAKDSRARGLGHAFNLGFSLGFGSWVYAYRGEAEELFSRADQCDEVGRENGLSFLTEMQAVFTRAHGLVLTERLDEGLAMFEQYFQSPMCLPVSQPYNLAVYAKALSLVRRHDEALEQVNRAIEVIQRSGWAERSHYAEVLRVRGAILGDQGDYEGSERDYLASLDWAREQKAKSWELRTSTSLAGLWQQQGMHKKAHDLLAPVYNWFTEGFDTKDLKEAKALLEKLKAAV
jgi:class 3 adenylate cyclase/tetratricopeptide (TPR) repeat protein